ncbi:hypothetical protein WJX73_009666 [Symbiochloris irregularis]|uniref:Uncharacterized protein n=1 Tax=Symbiochloris irregularis TaxID=706552 RepID=A0AAW1PLM3_9CHLO
MGEKLSGAAQRRNCTRLPTTEEPLSIYILNNGGRDLKKVQSAEYLINTLSKSESMGQQPCIIKQPEAGTGTQSSLISGLARMELGR